MTTPLLSPLSQPSCNRYACTTYRLILNIYRHLHPNQALHSQAQIMKKPLNGPLWQQTEFARTLSWLAHGCAGQRCPGTWMGSECGRRNVWFEGLTPPHKPQTIRDSRRGLLRAPRAARPGVRPRPVPEQEVSEGSVLFGFGFRVYNTV